jgi:hypothetical protein
MPHVSGMHGELRPFCIYRNVTEIVFVKKSSIAACTGSEMNTTHPVVTVSHHNSSVSSVNDRPYLDTRHPDVTLTPEESREHDYPVKK